MHSLIALSSIIKQSEADNLVLSLFLFNKFYRLLSPEINRQDGINVVLYSISVLQLLQMVYIYIYLLAILNHAIIVVTAITVNLLRQLSDIVSAMFQYGLLIMGLLIVNVVVPLEHCKSGNNLVLIFIVYLTYSRLLFLSYRKFSFRNFQFNNLDWFLWYDEILTELELYQANVTFTWKPINFYMSVLSTLYGLNG